MKYKIYSILLLIIMSCVVSAGCFGSNNNNDNNFNLYTDDLDAPDGKTVSSHQILWLNQVPKGKVFLQHSTSDPNLPTANCSRAWLSPVEKVEYADVVAYAHIKEVQPAVWDTIDGKAPEGYMTPTEWVDADGDTHIKYDTDNRGHILYTQVVFEIDKQLKGDSMDEVTVCLFGGETEDVVVYYHESGPAPWDFQNITVYLLYLSKTSSQCDNYVTIQDQDAYFVMFDGSYYVTSPYDSDW